MPATPAHPSDTKRKKIIRSLLALIGVLILLNVAATRFHKQADLTQDSRYTITPGTTKMLQHLNSYVSIQVFLEGADLPAGYKNLRASTEDLLRRFRETSNHKLDYKFIDPLAGDTAIDQLLKTYRMSGFPVTVADGKKGTRETPVFPWALVTVNGKSWPVLLQESNSPMISRKVLSQSALMLEYNLANAIHQLGKSAPDTVAYVLGNGEPDGYSVYAAVNTLSQYYKFEAIYLKDFPILPSRYKAIIVNRPLLAFDEVDKFKLDQYLVQGGSLFLAIDAVNASLDSFGRSPQFNALPIDLHLNDLLFTYGARLNPNLVADAEKCVDIPLESQSNKGERVPYPWVYFPILQSGSSHPIVKNMNEVLGRFVSSIDTVNANASLRKTVLLTTSKYSRVEGAPLPVILTSAMAPVDRNQFREPYRIVSLLIEGNFSSAYASRMPESLIHYLDSLQIKPLAASARTGKLIITSDGDMLLNDLREDGPTDMGMYHFSDYKFENKAFLLNCLEYLTDADNLLDARTKSYDTNLLDPTRVKAEESKWQWINVGLPVALVLLGGSVFMFYRKRRYAA